MRPEAFSLANVRAAQEALGGVALRTPLLENPDLDARLGGRLLIKAECAQRTGAFKLRGAWWRMAQMSAAERARGVITYSSGNHALGVALSARLLGSTALIVMPGDAPAQKVAAVRALGAEVTFFDRGREDYADVVARLARETGRIHVPPSGDARVLEGAGTVALEMLEQAAARDARLDAILVPCGGGGLSAATALVARELSPQSRIYAVEPALFDDTRRSLKAGRRLANPKGRQTICDAIMTPIPGEATFPINKALLAGALVARDEEVIEAMRLAFAQFKIVLEPGAAVSIAAVLNGGIDISGQTIGAIVTGGNIAPERFCRLIGGAGQGAEHR